MKLIAVTTYYNPCRFKRRLENYRRFRDRLLQQGVPLVTVEHVPDGGAPELETTGERHLLVRGGSVLWQKERLLNHAIAQLPAEYDAVAWLDCDVLFCDPGWRQRAEAMLEEHAIIQLYQLAIHLPKDQDEYQGEGYAVPAYFAQLRRGAVFGQVGLAWAARRSLLARHGLFDASIVGGGDSYILHALDGKLELISRTPRPPALWARYLRWQQAFAAEVSGRVGHLSGTLFHLWHGDLLDRGYDARHRILLDGDFDPDTDLRISESGAWEWASDKPQLHREVRDYFATRREDGDEKATALLPAGLLSFIDSEHFAPVLALAQAARQQLSELPVYLHDLGLQAAEKQQLDEAGIKHGPLPRLFIDLLRVGERDGRRWSLPDMLGRSPFQRTLWIDPESAELPSLARLFEALAAGPVLFSTPGKTAKNDPVGVGLGRKPLWDHNNCVVGVDLTRDAGLLDEWRQWLWRCAIYPHLRTLLMCTLSPTDFMKEALGLYREGPRLSWAPPPAAR